MFVIDSDKDGPPIAEPMASAIWADAQVKALRTFDMPGVIHDSVARCIAGYWSSPHPLDEQTLAVSQGRAYSTDDLLDEIARHRALARSSYYGAEYIQCIGSLDALEKWALRRSNGIGW